MQRRSYPNGQSASRVILCDMDLRINRIFQLGDMRDHTDQSGAVRELRQHLNCLPQRLFIERAEALVNEHRIEFNAAALCLNGIGKPQRQRQRREEGFAARER